MKTEADIKKEIQLYELMAQEAEGMGKRLRADRCRHIIAALNWVLTGTIGNYNEVIQ